MVRIHLQHVISADPRQLWVAVCIERAPLITREPTELERRYGDLCDRVEVEQSLLSDHELWTREYHETAKKQQKSVSEQRDADKSVLSPDDYDYAQGVKLRQFVQTKMAARQTGGEFVQS